MNDYGDKILRLRRILTEEQNAALDVLLAELGELQTWGKQVHDALDGRDLPPHPDEAPARIAALLAEREQAQDDLVRCQQARRIAMDERQQAIEALREIAEYGEKRDFQIYAGSMAEMARAALEQLGEQP